MSPWLQLIVQDCCVVNLLCENVLCRRKAKSRVDEPFAHVAYLHKDITADLHMIFFFHPTLLVHPSGKDLIELLHCSMSSGPKSECLKGPVVSQAGRVLGKMQTQAQERVACPALIFLSMWKRSSPNTRGGTNQTNLLPCNQKGQCVTKASCCEEECCGVAPSS